MWPTILGGALIGAVVNVAVYCVVQKIKGDPITLAGVGSAALAGAVSGAIAGSGAFLIAGAAKVAGIVATDAAPVVAEVSAAAARGAAAGAEVSGTLATEGTTLVATETAAVTNGLSQAQVIATKLGTKGVAALVGASNGFISAAADDKLSGRPINWVHATQNGITGAAFAPLAHAGVDALGRAAWGALTSDIDEAVVKNVVPIASRVGVAQGDVVDAVNNAVTKVATQAQTAVTKSVDDGLAGNGSDLIARLVRAVAHPDDALTHYLHAGASVAAQIGPTLVGNEYNNLNNQDPGAKGMVDPAGAAEARAALEAQLAQAQAQLTKLQQVNDGLSANQDKLSATQAELDSKIAQLSKLLEQLKPPAPSAPTPGLAGAVSQATSDP